MNNNKPDCVMYTISPIHIPANRLSLTSLFLKLDREQPINHYLLLRADN